MCYSWPVAKKALMDMDKQEDETGPLLTCVTPSMLLLWQLMNPLSSRALLMSVCAAPCSKEAASREGVCSIHLVHVLCCS